MAEQKPLLITDLPTEIIEAIVERIPIDTIPAVRLACRAFTGPATEQLFYNLYIRFNDQHVLGRPSARMLGLAQSIRLLHLRPIACECSECRGFKSQAASLVGPGRALELLKERSGRKIRAFHVFAPGAHLYPTDSTWLATLLSTYPTISSLTMPLATKTLRWAEFRAALLQLRSLSYLSLNFEYTPRNEERTTIADVQPIWDLLAANADTLRTLRLTLITRLGGPNDRDDPTGMMPAYNILTESQDDLLAPPGGWPWRAPLNLRNFKLSRYATRQCQINANGYFLNPQTVESIILIDSWQVIDMISPPEKFTNLRSLQICHAAWASEIEEVLMKIRPLESLYLTLWRRDRGIRADAVMMHRQSLKVLWVDGGFARMVDGTPVRSVDQPGERFEGDFTQFSVLEELAMRAWPKKSTQIKIPAQLKVLCTLREVGGHRKHMTAATYAKSVDLMMLGQGQSAPETEVPYPPVYIVMEIGYRARISDKTLMFLVRREDEISTLRQVHLEEAEEVVGKIRVVEGSIQPRWGRDDLP
ncbi:hypothetical protein TWF696_004581 [Orbilia brochopaga]|uniref:F-box domain-containing protein n=1 Tax=Orbilia brochopaga TaxID=3140254 RepID=A0AAV9V7B3_9PEZI